MKMTPRQLHAWAEIIAREEMLSDAKNLQLLRIAQHADKAGYNKFRKKLEEKGQ